jgi:hypothetical protein
MSSRQAITTRSISWSLLAMLAAGCASSGPGAANDSQARPLKQAITVIRSDAFHFDWDKEIRPVRADLERCAANAIEEHFTDLRYISRKEFTKTAFPDLPGDSAPTDLRYIRLVLDSPTVRQRLEPLNLRYIVYVGGHTEIEASHSWVIIGGYMAATAAGVSTWAKGTEVDALVFDLQNPQRTTSAEDHEHGTSWVAGLFPFIVGMPTGSENRACKEIGEQLVHTLSAARNLETQN